jgi:hypothetical protein
LAIFSMLHIVKTQSQKNSMPKRMKDVFVKHNAFTKYLSCSQSLSTVGKISIYLGIFIFTLFFKQSFSF